MAVEFVDIEQEYFTECGKAGTLEKLCYTSNSYDESNIVTEKEALVYLPYGYGEDVVRSYNVLFLMHGGGCDQEDLFGGLDARTDLKHILDHMIADGLMEPLVVVTPTFYFQGTESALRSTVDARLLTENFHQELIKDLLPAVEENYRVKRSRENRAFGGFSMGSEATWNVFARCLKDFKYFLPMCGDYWVIQLKGGLECPVETVDRLVSAVREAKQDFFLAPCVGDNDVAYEAEDSLVREMMTRPEFVFAKNYSAAEGGPVAEPSANAIYYVEPGGIHVREYVHKYVRNVLPMFFR